MKRSFLRHPLVVLPVVFSLGAWAGARFLPGKTAGGSLLENPPDLASFHPQAGQGPASGKIGAAPQNPPAVPDLTGLSPGEVRKILDGLTDSAVRQEAIRRYLSSVPPASWSDWIEKFASLEQRSPEKADLAGMARRYGRLTDLLASVAAVDPVGFMATLHSTGERNNDGESESRYLVMMHWAEQNPAAAQAFLREQLASGKPMAGLADSAKAIAAVMAREDSAGVLAWAATLPAKEQAQATAAALSELAWQDPRDAAQRLSGLKEMPDLNKENLAGKITEAWAKRDAGEALRWAAAQSGRMRKKGIEGALGGLRGDSAKALAAVKSLPPEAIAMGLGGLMSQKLGDSMAGEVAGLLEQQPQTPDRADASAAVMSVWTSQDPEAASRWMQRQPAGEVRDSAIQAFVRWADVRDPEAALLWAGSMSDAAKRIDAIDHIIEQLNDKAPAAVQPWLDGNPALTEMERSRILEKMNRPR